MSDSRPVCLGPGGEIAAEHTPTEMEPVENDSNAWECPQCVVIVRV